MAGIAHMGLNRVILLVLDRGYGTVGGFSIKGGQQGFPDCKDRDGRAGVGRQWLAWPALDGVARRR